MTYKTYKEYLSAYKSGDFKRTSNILENELKDLFLQNQFMRLEYERLLKENYIFKATL